MKFYLTFLLLVSSHICFTQNESEWLLFHTEKGVEFYQKEIDCQPENIPNQVGIIIKVKNTNKKSIAATWDLRLWYDQKEITNNIADKENQLTIIIPEQSEKEGSCNEPFGNLYILKKFTTFSNGANLTDFKFDNISVTLEK